MAGLEAVHAVGRSLVGLLTDLYPDEESAPRLPRATFQSIASGQLSDFAPTGTTVTLYLFRLGIDPYLRNGAPHATPAELAARPLTLELHYLITAWADGAFAEQTVLAWTMLQLHQRPILDASMLASEGGWQPDEEVHIVPSELSHEDMMRVWDALQPAYRLSVSYIARVVRIEGQPVAAGRPVVATRFDYDHARSRRRARPL